MEFHIFGIGDIDYAANRIDFASSRKFQMY